MSRVPEYHNMSVPSTSILTVAREALSGPRFSIDFRAALEARKEKTPTEQVMRGRLRRCGWRAAARLLGLEVSSRGKAARAAQRQALAQKLAAALSDAGVPDRIGVFCPDAEASGTRLDPAACLAVLARRSGPLYLPARGFEPSLVEVAPLTLVFPEEVDHDALD